MNIPESVKKIRDERSSKVGNALATPTIRSMYPSLSRGEMAAKFSDCYAAGFDAGYLHQEERIKMLEKALEFYADKKNWRYYANNDVGSFDAWLDFKPDHFCKEQNESGGGYLARQALQKSRGEKC